MRRTIRVMVMMALLVGTFGVVANAATITCGNDSDRDGDSVDCEGTNNRDEIDEREGDFLEDIIFGLNGGDNIYADGYTDDRDELYGGSGNDRLNTADDDDRENVDFINCGKGKNDVAIIDPRDHVNHNNCERIRVER